ncbi:MAG: hypothetical protein JXR10_12925 [Cyclobacteriaceae bacterium]
MNKVLRIPVMIILSGLFFSCSDKKDLSFADDVALLTEHVDDIIILSAGDAKIAVSPSMQGRIFTSTSNGMNGRSYEWYDRSLIESGEYKYSFHKIGGAGRLWFGPEAGKFSAFFEPGAEQTAENIRISPDLTNKPFELLGSERRALSCVGRLNIRNAAGTKFSLMVNRTIKLLTREEVWIELGIDSLNSLACVAYQAETKIMNTDRSKWPKSKGLLSIWELSCMHPTPNTWVIIPTRGLAELTTYFTELPENRVRRTADAIFYKADASYMNKIGLKPEFSKNVFGSYSQEKNLLTIVNYTLGSDSALYVNSQWGNTAPYDGDVLNIFNGEVNRAEDRNWPFYEMETSSNAQELRPGEVMSHTHTTFHFEGTRDELESIANQVLGVSLKPLGE